MGPASASRRAGSNTTCGGLGGLGTCNPWSALGHLSRRPRRGRRLSGQPCPARPDPADPAPAPCPPPALPAAPWRRSMRSALLARLSCTRPWLVATQRCCACCASGAALPACAGRQPPRALQASRPSTWSRCSGTQASFRLCLVSGRKLLPRLLEGRVLAAGRLYAYEGSGGGGSAPCSTAKDGREQARALPCPGQL